MIIRSIPPVARPVPEAVPEAALVRVVPGAALAAAPVQVAPDLVRLAVLLHAETHAIEAVPVHARVAARI